MLVKKIFIYAVICGLALLIGYSAHSFILDSKNIEHPFTLFNIYLFQCIATLVLCAIFEIIAQKSEQLKNQLGFLYLAAMALKVILFCVFFSGILFASIVLTKMDSFSLLIPIFLFLLVEVIIIVNILNRNNENINL